MSLVELKAAVQAGQDHTARWLFVQVLDDPGLSRAELAEAYCEASVAEYRSGHLHTAVAWAKVAAGLSSEMGLVSLLSRVSQNLVEFLRLSGETAAAIQTGLRWIESYGDHPEASFRTGRVYYNVALTHRQRDETEKALACYEKAWTHLDEAYRTHHDRVERERSLVYEVMALQNAAWVMYELDRNTQGDTLVERAKAILPKGNGVLALEQDLLEALRAHKAGDPESVLTMVDQIFTSRTLLADQQQLFWLYWLAAQGMIRQGKSGLAGAYAAMATQEAEDSKIGRLIRLAQSLESEISMVAS